MTWKSQGTLLDERALDPEGRYRRGIRARGHFPTEHAAPQCHFLISWPLDPTDCGWARSVIRWMNVLDASAVTAERRRSTQNHQLARRSLTRKIRDSPRATCLGSTCATSSGEASYPDAGMSGGNATVPGGCHQSGSAVV